MHFVRHVARAPAKPLMIYDGDCGFCRRWIQRWKRQTGSAVEYREAADPLVAEQFSEISEAQFAEAVHIIMPNSTVYFGGEAVLQGLAAAGSQSGARLLKWYLRCPPLARLIECAYRWIAQNRRWLSKIL